MKLYHGSPYQNIKEFNLDRPRFENPTEGFGIYLTEQYKVARDYAGSEGSIYVCELTNQATFDSTQIEEYEFILKKISKQIKFDLLKLDYMDLTLKNLVHGQYQISTIEGTGFSWQIKNLLYNNEAFLSLKNSEEITDLVVKLIEEYLAEHYTLKYNSGNIGTVYVVRDPSIIKINKEIVIGSKEDEENI